MSDARDRILGRVRGALARARPLDDEQAAILSARICAHPPGPRPRTGWDLPVRFRERALALASTVDAVETMQAVPRSVANYLTEQGLAGPIVIAPELRALDWNGAGLRVESRASTGTDAIGITGVYCAIAETGTLALLSGADTPAATSLLPETHVAIVPVNRLVATMEDAWSLLRTERGAPPRAVNFISGPSRTADIELTIVLGAHGPYRVHIVLVHGA